MARCSEYSTDARLYSSARRWPFKAWRRWGTKRDDSHHRFAHAVAFLRYYLLSGFPGARHSRSLKYTLTDGGQHVHYSLSAFALGWM